MFKQFKLLFGDIHKFPIGHRCKCGKEHKWPAYIYAHFTEEIIHTCDCGIKATICDGRVY